MSRASRRSPRRSTRCASLLALLVVAAVAARGGPQLAEVSADIAQDRRRDLRCSPPCSSACRRSSPCWAGGCCWPTSARPCTSRRPAASSSSASSASTCPGSVWSIVAQAEMGARLHIPRRRSAVVGRSSSVAIAAICGLIVGLPALPLLITRDDSAARRAGSLLLAVPAAGRACSGRGCSTGASRTVLRLLRREPLEHRLSGRAVLRRPRLFIARLGVLRAARARPRRGRSATDYEHRASSLLATCRASRWRPRWRCSASSCPPASASARACWCCILAPVTSTSAATAVVVHLALPHRGRRRRLRPRSAGPTRARTTCSPPARSASTTTDRRCDRRDQPAIGCRP